MSFRVKNRKYLPAFLSSKEIPFGHVNDQYLSLEYKGDVFKLFEDFLHYQIVESFNKSVRYSYNHGWTDAYSRFLF